MTPVRIELIETTKAQTPHVVVVKKANLLIPIGPFFSCPDESESFYSHLKYLINVMIYELSFPSAAGTTGIVVTPADVERKLIKLRNELRLELEKRSVLRYAPERELAMESARTTSLLLVMLVADALDLRLPQSLAVACLLPWMRVSSAAMAE